MTKDLFEIICRDCGFRMYVEEDADELEYCPLCVVPRACDEGNGLEVVNSRVVEFIK